MVGGFTWRRGNGACSFACPCVLFALGKQWKVGQDGSSSSSSLSLSLHGDMVFLDGEILRLELFEVFLCLFVEFADSIDLLQLVVEERVECLGLHLFSHIRPPCRLSVA